MVSTFFTLQSQINISDYTSLLLSNLFSVFLDAGFIFDNSSLSMNLVAVLHVFCSNKTSSLTLNGALNIGDI